MLWRIPDRLVAATRWRSQHTRRAFAGFNQTQQQFEQRTLPGPIWPQDDDKLTLVHRNIHILKDRSPSQTNSNML
jgi:hypothetical protein